MLSAHKQMVIGALKRTPGLTMTELVRANGNMMKSGAVRHTVASLIEDDLIMVAEGRMFAKESTEVS